VLNGQKTALSHKIVSKEKEPKEMLKARPGQVPQPKKRLMEFKCILIDVEMPQMEHGSTRQVQVGQAVLCFVFCVSVANKWHELVKRLWGSGRCGTPLNRLFTARQWKGF